MERIVLTVVVCLLAFGNAAICMGQTDDELKKFEAAALFSSITKPEFSSTETDAGVGARFTFNLNKSIALEAEGIIFPHRCFGCKPENRGRLSEFFAGIKAGKRFEHFGVFAKARPGLANFSRGENIPLIISNAVGQFPFVDFEQHNKTNFAADLGAVVEFYPTKRVFVRFYAGDTMIRYTNRINTFLTFDAISNTVTPIVIRLPTETVHNFQFTSSVGFRF